MIKENEQLKIRLAEWEKLRGTAGPSVSKVEIEEDADVTGMVNARMEEIKLVKEIDGMISAYPNCFR